MRRRTIGFIVSLARPGGTIAGFSLGAGDGVGGKWLELFKPAVSWRPIAVWALRLGSPALGQCLCGGK